MPERRSRQIRHIYLTGFSGSGKSTVGERLAVKLGYRFLDLDTVIARKMLASVTEIFDQYGERRFRMEETRVLRLCSSKASPAVIAVGGGTTERSVNRRIMRRSGTVVYLRCSLTEIRRRLRDHKDRPLLRGQGGSRERLRELLNLRMPTYERADITVITSGKTVGHVVTLIIDKMKRHEDAD